MSPRKMEEAIRTLEELQATLATVRPQNDEQAIAIERARAQAARILGQVCEMNDCWSCRGDKLAK